MNRLKPKNHVMKTLFPGIFLFLALLIPVGIWASISVSPTLFELQIPRGKSYTDAIRVVNVGKAGITIKVYLSDFDFQAK